MAEVPKWLEELGAEHKEAILQAYRGIERYSAVMEAIARKAAAEKELGGDVSVYSEVEGMGRRGQETAEQMWKQWNRGPADDFYLLRAKFEQPEDNPKNRKANPTPPSASGLVGRLKF